ncbi:hypothetical protein C0214_10900 [Methylobacterium sp. DM1]|nr:hypothetical protein C0214_10900 [Methylobacterium sp. DM1]MBI1691943.1 hypothetical protein [Methylorubrum sp. DB1722]
MDDRLDALTQEVRALRRLVEALVTALAPDETPAERSLIETLTELTQSVDDAGAVVSSMHSTVSSLARPRPVYEPA